jgi:oxygen-independent coproporphyrinogen III oxidase
MAGLYIHIPFCRKACHYCDFHFSTSAATMTDMAEAINREMILRRSYLKGEELSSVYFGGGTPSLLDPAQVARLIGTARNAFGILPEAEITLEANPDDLNSETLEGLLNAGINRLSIGIQSFSDEDLRFMNRAHDAAQALDSVRAAKEAGFTNLTIDLIYGSPTTSMEQWKKNLDTAFSLGVDHLSCYSLTVESRTALAVMIRQKKVPAPDDEKSSAQFELLMDMAAKAGYDHYEISNFARDGKYSRHNTSYWQRKKYIGVGPSAHSFDIASRQWNVYNNPVYIKSLQSGIIPFEKEELTRKDKFNEYILTSLRTKWGVDTNVVEAEFGQWTKEDLLEKLLAKSAEGLVREENGVFTLTRKGKFFADRISAELFA